MKPTPISLSICNIPQWCILLVLILLVIHHFHHFYTYTSSSTTNLTRNHPFDSSIRLPIQGRSTLPFVHIQYASPSASPSAPSVSLSIAIDTGSPYMVVPEQRLSHLIQTKSSSHEVVSFQYGTGFIRGPVVTYPTILTTFPTVEDRTSSKSLSVQFPVVVASTYRNMPSIAIWGVDMASLSMRHLLHVYSPKDLSFSIRYQMPTSNHRSNHYHNHHKVSDPFTGQLQLGQRSRFPDDESTVFTCFPMHSPRRLTRLHSATGAAAPVSKTQWWQFPIARLEVWMHGRLWTVLEDGLQAIADTGTGALVVPKRAIPESAQRTSDTTASLSASSSVSALPTYVVVSDTGSSLTISPQDYVEPSSSGTHTNASRMLMSSETFGSSSFVVLGYPCFRSYEVLFDYGRGDVRYRPTRESD